MGAHRSWLPGDRLHLQHGPIDLIIDARGDSAVVREAHAAAWCRFQAVLAELVAELPVLRGAIRKPDSCPLAGPISRRMWSACRPFHRPFITPMAAVAGAVADEIAAFYRVDGIQKAFVNNGGDIAIHLAQGQATRMAVIPEAGGIPSQELLSPRLTINVNANDPVRGVATSGWRGRSFSLGIADSATILADTAAAADAAATVVANAVDIPHPGIVRRRARELQPDSDLADRLVTVHVPELSRADVARALALGHRRALQLIRSKLIHSAMLVCQGQVRVVGELR